jgi:hypothetical protein
MNLMISSMIVITIELMALLVNILVETSREQSMHFSSPYKETAHACRLFLPRDAAEFEVVLTRMQWLLSKDSTFIR